MTLILNRRTLICLQRYNDGKYLPIKVNIDHLALCGHLSAIIYFNNNPMVRCTSNAMDWAAKSGYLNIVKWLHNNRSEGCSAYAMNDASFCGHLNVMIWLRNNRDEGCTMCEIHGAMTNALRNNNIKVIEFLKQHYCFFV
jgi:hypothetical protein